MSNRELLERCLNALEWVYGGEPCDLEGTIQAVKAELSKPLQSEELSAELIAGIISCYQPHDKEHPSKCLPIAKNIMESVVTPLISELKSKLTEAGKDAERYQYLRNECCLIGVIYDKYGKLLYDQSDVNKLQTQNIEEVIDIAISNNTKELGRGE